MGVPAEIEIKFVVEDVRLLETKLRELGFREQTKPTFELNTLYDVASHELRSRGEVLRIRRYGDRWTVTHKSKGNDGRHKTREEHETSVADGMQVDAIFRALGYSPIFIYEKFRSEWTDGTGHVVIDRTPIGHFAEIEGDADWIDEVAKRIGVGEDRYITKSYAALFLDWRAEHGSNAEHMTFDLCGTIRAELP